MTDHDTGNLHSDVSELRRDLAAHRKHVEKSDRRNQDDHKAMMATMIELVSDRKALRLLGVLVGIAIGSMGGTITYFANKLDDVAHSANQHEAESTQRAVGLRRDVDDNKKRTEELQRLHRRPDERNRFRPGEE